MADPRERIRVLCVDDEPNVLESLCMLLEHQYEVLTANSGEEAIRVLTGTEVAVVLMDISMPGMGGVAALQAIKALNLATEVVMVTAVREVNQAVACMKAGAYDFLAKPWDALELRSLLKRAAEKWLLTRENLILRSQPSAPAEALVGSGEAMRRVRERLVRIGSIDATVLITGESGTGKELAARAIHEHSGRREGRFVAINCAAIPRDMVESELFGHEKGAFTSAVAIRIGKFEYASGGTLLLDDVPNLPLETQAKLLRVLEDKAITRLGSNRSIPVDVRVIASSNQDLKALVDSGGFRADLYYRLNGVPVDLPSLRDRGGDLEELLSLFVERACQRHRLSVPQVHPRVIEALKLHAFPGNVRELQNLAETLVVLCEDGMILPEALPASILAAVEKKEEPFKPSPGMDILGSASNAGLRDTVRTFERQVLVQALKQAGANQSQAARDLGVHRNTLVLKIQEYSIESREYLPS
jgi:DNA-binding NtrC family response regulator